MPDKSDEPPHPNPYPTYGDVVLPRPPLEPMILMSESEMNSFFAWSAATGYYGGEVERTAEGIRIRPTLGEGEWFLLGRFSGSSKTPRSGAQPPEQQPAAAVPATLLAPPTTGIGFEATNVSWRFARVSIRWTDGNRDAEMSKVLSPGQTWRSTLRLPTAQSRSAGLGEVSARSVPLPEILTTDRDSGTLRFVAYASTTAPLALSGPRAEAPEFR